MGLEGMFDGILAVDDVFCFTHTCTYTFTHTDKGTNDKTLNGEHHGVSLFCYTISDII